MYETIPYPVVTLDSVADVLDHLRAPINSEARSFRLGVVPYYGANGQQGWIDKHLTNEPLILLAEDGGNFDEYATRPIAYKIDGPAWVNNHAHILRAKQGNSQNFIYWSIAHKDIRRFIAGGTRTKLTQGELRRIEIGVPKLEEQTLIAKILDTLDTTIRQTEAIIEKLKQVKQGLLHDLLTRGIDANGELRPPQGEAPELYKESALGWIPREWDIKPFGRLCESSAFGPRFPSDAYDENGPLATLRTTDMDDDGNITRATMPRAAIAPSLFSEHLLQLGDIVISRSGTCGVTGVFIGHDIAVVPGAFLIRFRLRDDRLNQFYRRYFNSPIGRPKLERLAVGGVQKNIKGSDVLKLPVPVPPPDEALKIANRIFSLEHDIESNRLMQSKLLLQKSGLMDDLLTGRVRVTPLLESAAA